MNKSAVIKCTFFILLSLLPVSGCDSAFYGFVRVTVANPSISPKGGVYDSSQSVTITCATSGAVIRYTTDGSDPDETSTVYSGPISLTGTDMTVKAYAARSGLPDSRIVSQSYVIRPVGIYPTFTYIRPISVTENSSNNLTDYQVLITLTPATFDYAHVLTANPNDIRFFIDNAACSYWIEDWDTGGTSKIWVRVPALNANETKTMFMFYGDASAVQANDGDSTFILFDDFNDNSLDTAKWTDISMSAACVTEQSQMLYSMNDAVNEKRGYLRSANEITESNIAFHFDSLFEGTESTLIAAIHFDGNQTAAYNTPDNAFYLDWYTSNTISLDSVVSGTINVLAALNGYTVDLNPHSFQLRYYNQNVEIVFDDVLVTSVSSSQVYTTKYIGLAAREKLANTYFDNVFVRKYVSPEPGFIIHSEELNP